MFSLTFHGAPLEVFLATVGPTGVSGAPVTREILAGADAEP